MHSLVPVLVATFAGVLCVTAGIQTYHWYHDRQTVED